MESAAPWAEEVLKTADDLAALPDDAWRYELVRGRVVRMSPAGFKHGEIALQLASVIRQFVVERGLGRVVGAETGFRINPSGEPDTVLAPDVAFVAASRVPEPDSPDRTGFPRLAPDLVVEVASPSQGRMEMQSKARTWIDAGVRMVCVVWPADREVEIYVPDRTEPARTLGAVDVLDGGEVLPGFSFRLAGLWE